MKISLFCKCGGAMAGTVKAGTAAGDEVESIFRAAHQTPACGKATKEEAAKARRQQRRLEDRS